MTRRWSDTHDAHQARGGATKLEHVSRLRGLSPTGPFDDHAALLRGLLEVDVAAVMLPQDNGVLLAGLAGATLASDQRRLASDWPLCHEVVRRDRLVSVEDLATRPDLRGDGAPPPFPVEAYAGVPLHGPDGAPIGAVCAVHGSAHAWTEHDLDTLRRVGDVVAGRVATWAAGEETADHAEELRVRMAVLGHELANELTIIVNGIVTSRRPDLAADVRERLLQLVEENARGTAETLDAMLRADDRAGRAVADVDLDTLLAHAVSRPHAELRVVVEQHGASVRSDGHLLLRVVENLVDNALKYGGPTVHVRATRHDGGARVVVHDDGRGMHPDEVAQLFAPYGQLHDTDVGYGLGLFIVRELMRRLSGRVDVDVESGTRITLEVPDLDR